MEDFVRRVGNKETLEKELTQAKALHEELERRKGAFKAALKAEDDAIKAKEEGIKAKE